MFKDKLPLIITIVVLILCVAGIGFFIWMRSADAAKPKVDSNPAWYLGDPNGTVTVEIYEDFQCPHCKDFTEEIQPKLVEDFKGKSVKFVYRHFTIFLPLSDQLALASETAGAQGKFWEFHDRLFAGQKTISTLDQYLAIAKDLGLNVDQFRSDYTSAKYKGDVESDKAAATKLGISSTPTVVVNGKVITASSTSQLESYENAINTALGIPFSTSSSSTAPATTDSSSSNTATATQ